MKTWIILIFLATTVAVSFSEDVETKPEPEENSKNSWLSFDFFKKISTYFKGGSDKENAGEESPTTDEEKERQEEEEDTAHVNASTNERLEEEKGEKEEIAYVNDTSTEEEVEMPVITSTQAGPTTILTTPAATTCPPRSNPWASCTNPTPEDDTKLAEALTEFAVEFYKAAIQNEKHTSNLVFSPISISTILSNLLLGTCGETTDRLEKLLFYPKGFTCVHKALKAFSKSEALTSANAIFYQPAFNLDSEFRNLTWEFYQTKMSLLSNNSNQAVLDINAWVSKHTGNKIKKLLEDLEPDAQMVLLNAIYFQAKWKTLFRLKNTKEEEFYRPGLSPISVPMLTSKKYPVASYFDSYLQAKVGRFQMSHNMSLVIIVPRSLSQSLSEVEERLSADVFKSVMTKLESIHFKPTIVSLPKFKVESSQDLMEIIGRMDYGFFFDASLCGISPDKDLAISSAQHKAVVQISEEGVEAAAASGVSLARSANFFEVQQPFLFVVSRDGKAPLFLGRIVDPQ